MSADEAPKPFPDHLRPDEVLQIIDFMAGCDPIVVGGQSVNIWAELYAARNLSLGELGPFTSKDVDFFRNKAAAEALADRLEDGTIFLPTLADMATPSAAVVVGNLNGRRLQVDFMSTVLGVDDDAILKNFVAIEGSIGDKVVSLFLMHPLDCVRSRLANVNTLRRHDDHSLRQAAASLSVLDAFIQDLLDAGNAKASQRVLRDLQFVVRDLHLGKASHLAFGDRLDPLALMGRYLEEQRLDERWRSLALRRAVERLRRRSARLERLHAQGPLLARRA